MTSGAVAAGIRVARGSVATFPVSGRFMTPSPPDTEHRVVPAGRRVDDLKANDRRDRSPRLQGSRENHPRAGRYEQPCSEPLRLRLPGCGHDVLGCEVVADATRGMRKSR